MPPPPPERIASSYPITLTSAPAIDLREYWLKIRKHFRLILTFLFSCVLLAGLIVVMMKPTYRAESTLLIERTTPQVLNMKEVMQEPVVEDEYDYYKTQYGILQGITLVTEVIRQQGLTDKDLLPDTTENLSGLFRGLSLKFQALLSRTGFGARIVHSVWGDGKGGKLIFGVRPKLIDAYMKRLKIEPVRGTRLAKVEFSNTDAELAARIVNAHVLAYIRTGLELNSHTNEEAQHFLEGKLVELKDRVEKSEEALNAYRRDKGIISLDDKEDIVVQRLDDLNKSLTVAEAERIALEAQVQQVKGRDYNELPAVVGNELVQRLKQEHSQLEGEYAKVASKFRPGYPPLDQLHAQLVETNGRIQHETEKVAQSIDTNYQTALAKESELRAKLNEQKSMALGQKDAGVRYAILAREVDTNKQLYDSVLQRMKETGVAAEVRASNVFIIDRATPPHIPAQPRTNLYMLIALVFGAAGGVALAFASESLDNTLKNPDEVEKYLRLPSLAVVPNFLSANGVTYGSPPRLSSQMEKELTPTARKELVTFRDRFSAVAESYRTLRTALLLSKAGEPPRTLLVTSATSSEGKTVTAVNTAVLFAQMGVRVLLIDADLRRPRCHKLLRVDNRVGLSEVLTGQVEVDDAICSTMVDQLFLLGSGAIPPNPAELVGSSKMHDTLNYLRERFDFIVIDSVPTIVVSDALPLATMADGAVLVVNGPQTPKHLVKAAAERLSYVGANILGVVLNNVDTRSPDYYYSHYYYSESDSKYYQRNPEAKDQA
jgi:capsular exopolysaccharide synthesis family protein